MNPRYKLVLTTVALVCAARASATVTINLSTGLNSEGVVQTTGGTSDAQWMTNSSPAKVVAPGTSDWWGFWPANDVASSWIARDPTTSSGNGVGVYSRSFDLTGLDLGGVSLAGNWAVDDEGTLTLNGHQIGAYQPHDGWKNFATQTFAVTDPSWFNQGLNSLVLTIAKSDNFFEGVRFQGSVTATPEPSSLELIAIVAAATYRCRRRKGLRPVAGSDEATA